MESTTSHVTIGEVAEECVSLILNHIHELGTHRCDNAERSLKAPSGTTEMSFPCNELKAKKKKRQY